MPTTLHGFHFQKHNRPPDECGNRPQGLSGNLWGLLGLLAISGISGRCSMQQVTILPPAAAHQLQVHQEVGAILHIEPQDRPRAGEPTTVWFALTRSGGTVIPLEECDCTLTVYDQANQAIARPVLFSRSTEGYSQMPAATVTFPQVGAYTLVLTGEPVAGDAFPSFELPFEVTVAVRAQAPAPSRPESGSPDPEMTPATALSDPAPAETSPASPASIPWRRLLPWAAGGLLIGICWGIIGGLRSPGGKS